jgi:hypothetical protein
MKFGEVCIFDPESRKMKTVKFDEMTIEQLKAYRASVEAYGTARELYEVEERIRELEGGNKDE